MAQEYEYLYVVLSLAEWLNIKDTGNASMRKGFDDFYTSEVGTYFEAEISKRTNHGICNDFCYCFYEIPHWVLNRGRNVLCRVRVSQDHVVPFDDNGFLHIVNNIISAPSSILGNITDLDYLESSENIFLSKNDNPCGQYQCKPVLRAFIPELTRNMITKVRHYRFGKRLRR